MKSKIFSRMVAAAVLSAPLILWSACTDTWDDHYGVADGVAESQASLLVNIADDPDLENFYRVVQSIGASTMLDAPGAMTVWAPLNLTRAQADSVIAVYQADETAGLKSEDNKAMTQFLQNHVSMYIRTVSAETNDTVAMLNGKYMNLTGTSNSSGKLQENPFDGAVLCNNGMLYKAENVQTFFPNIREYVDMADGLDSLSAFFALYDEYELDENASVSGGVVDGKTVYLDSVTNLKNDVLSKYGYVQREDSTYYFIAPTNEVWNEEYSKYLSYYNYANIDGLTNPDSLADAQAKTNIICGRFFNMSKASRYNYHPEDSLCNTQYSSMQTHNPRQNVYYHPETGILQGLEKIECSNGYVYIDDQRAIDPTTTFFGRKDMEATMNYEVPTNDNNVETMIVTRNTYYKMDTPSGGTVTEPSDEEDADTESSTSTDTSTDSQKTYSYITVVARTASAQTSMEYKMKDLFSNCYYNIYLVTIPDEDTHLPLWFQVSQKVMNANGGWPSASTYFTNPHPVTEGSVDNSETILNQSNNTRCFVASAEKVDTILLQAAVTYPYSGVGIDDETVQLTVGSFGPSSSTYRERVYTRTLRLNEIILVPFETEAEALAAADDKDAFNDELLEANKEN